MQRPDLDELSHFVGAASVLDGKYLIERILGVGGMGVVVSAQHLRLGESVAIKFLLPRALGMQQRTARFLREARAASRIKSAHVARVYDVDVRADGAPYIVMELLRGETLQAMLEKGPLPESEAVDTALEVCEALTEAHALGIVHRDLKPANLFLARGAGNVVTLKVLDFGISKILEPNAPDATTGEAFLGSPPYMSPEQLTSPGNVDHRSDVWALGVILYQCLSGEPPFASASFAEICALILQAEPRPLSELRPELPGELTRAVERCMRKDRERRFDSMFELARAIARHGSARSARSLVVIEGLLESMQQESAEDGSPRPERPHTLDTGTLTAAADGSPPLAGRRGEFRWGRALLAVTLIATAVAVALWNRGPPADGPRAGSGGWEGARSVASRGTELGRPDPVAPATTGNSSPAAATPTPTPTPSELARRISAPLPPGKPAKSQVLKNVSPAAGASGTGRRIADPIFDERK